MKTTLLLLTGIFFFGQLNAQVFNKCMTPEAIHYQESLTPGYINQVNTVFDNAKAYSANNIEKSNHLYTIPVVVHIVYNAPEQNLHDSVVLNQIKTLNEDYNRQNADTVNMRPDFDIVKGSPQIEFVLAQIDENGLPTTGITRTLTSQPSFGSFAIITGDFTDLEKVKSTADGGHDPWDQSRYLNIWVCNMSVDVFGTEVTALLGYATPPDGLPNWPPGSTNGMSDGVVIQYQAFGSNNPNVLDAGAGPINVLGRTSSHEVGHYLGLRHIWGDGDCTAQDGIDDTPNADAQSNSDCDITKNTCTDNIQGTDLPDMVENYMDYSAESCQNTFTKGQVDLMHGVLENERYDLTHNNPAGVNELVAFNWSVYPNPASESITISSASVLSEVRIYDLSGMIVDKVDLSSTDQSIDVSKLGRGMYLIEVVNVSQKRESKRIVVQ